MSLIWETLICILSVLFIIAAVFYVVGEFFATLKEVSGRTYNIIVFIAALLIIAATVGSLIIAIAWYIKLSPWELDAIINSLITNYFI